MIPVLPNPFNPDDTEFVLDSDAFMAALAPDSPADGRFLLQQEMAQGKARQNFVTRERLYREPSIAPDKAAGRPVEHQPRVEPRFTADVAKRRLHSLWQAEMPEHAEESPRARSQNTRTPDIEAQSIQHQQPLDEPVHDPMLQDQEALFYLAGSEPQSIVPEYPHERPTRK